MKHCLLSCYLQMLPRLKAEEQLQQVGTLNAASPYAKDHVKARAISRLRRMASGDREEHGVHLSEMTPRQERAALAMVGMAVQTVPQKPN